MKFKLTRFKILLILLAVAVVSVTAAALIYTYVWEIPWVVAVISVAPPALLFIVFVFTVRCPHCGAHLLLYGGGFFCPVDYCPSCGEELDHPF